MKNNMETLRNKVKRIKLQSAPEVYVVLRTGSMKKIFSGMMRL